MRNDTWRQAEEQELTAEELAARLDWQLLSINADDLVPVEFGYDAGELFGHHGVTVEVDDELQFRDINLRGSEGPSGGPVTDRGVGG